MSAVSFTTLIVDERLAHLNITIDLDDEAHDEMGDINEKLALLVSLQHLYCIAKMNWPEGVIDDVLTKVWNVINEQTSAKQETNSHGRELLLRGDKGRLGT